jgi:hypothetical protein
MQLAVTDVEGDDADRTSLQQTIGESAGGRTGVEEAHTGNVEIEGVERRVELLSSAADEARWWSGQDDGIACCHLVRRLAGDCAVDEHAMGGDDGGGFGSTRHETAPYELGVETSPDSCHDPTMTSQATGAMNAGSC